MSSRVEQSKMDQLLSDVEKYIQDPSNRQNALKQLSSLSDYTGGDDVGCNAQAAVENCEQIKGYFPPSAPPSTIENLNAIIEAIKVFEKSDDPIILRLLTNPIVLLIIGLGIAAYWFFGR